MADTPGLSQNGARQRILSVLVENQFGVLARISGLFGMRGFNIDSLAVGETYDPAISRITLVTHGDERVVSQILNQLQKLVEVIAVQDITQAPHVERELMLIKVNASSETRPQIIEIVDVYKGKIVDFTPQSLTVEIVGGSQKVESFIELMRPFGVAELARTGRVALNRGPGGLQSGFLARAEQEAPAAAGR